MAQHPSTQQGFSLVELSIVLVILGLLVGGVLSGQSLIRAAEMRSVITDFDRYQSALLSFRDKYFAYPGDMSNATSFWGDQASGADACASATTADGTPGTCNGNANGLIEINQEMFRSWQQLAMAGLIEGSYTGQNGGGTGCGSACDAVIGVNVPRSKISNAGYSFYQIGFDPVADAAQLFDTQLATSNSIVIGAKDPNFWTFLATILKPEEAWNIDTKIDDGRPQYGKLHTWRSTTCTTTTASATAAYALSTSNKVCNLLLKF